MLLLGDGFLRGGSYKVRDLVLQVLMMYQDEVPRLLDEDPEWAAARGARVMGRRWVEGYSEGDGADEERGGQLLASDEQSFELR